MPGGASGVKQHREPGLAEPRNPPRRLYRVFIRHNATTAY